MKNKPTPRIPATNIQDFLQLAVFIASERPNPNDFLRREANVARITWAKKQEPWIRQMLNMIISASDPQAFILQTYENMRMECALELNDAKALAQVSSDNNLLSVIE
jgi:hypothetical protein